MFWQNIAHLASIHSETRGFDTWKFEGYGDVLSSAANDGGQMFEKPFSRLFFHDEQSGKPIANSS